MKHNLKQFGAYKRSAALSILALMAATLSACGNENEPSQSSSSKAESPAQTAASASGDGPNYLDVITTDTASEKGFALGGVAMGNPDAPVTIIEYASLTCPHCAAFHKDVLPGLKENFIQSGKVRYVFYNYVMNRIDLAASSISRCFGPERFFPLSDLFFSRQREWLANARDQGQVIDDMAALVRRAGISRTEFDQCLAERDLQQHLVEMTSGGQARWQITGTPTIIVDGKKRGAEAQNYEGLAKMINDKL
ncbi:MULTISPECIES: DsbA family protein [unclassified Iodidimonas]|jgi:protein-disulfide isomerase|uniref:DsbA family protein n=1 Tax=unclassified Iodidimonas TaxID=2626145 RepID=UPI002482C887|nr:MULTISPECIES: DsbA family protein [unclassified Iodidimonas]